MTTVARSKPRKAPNTETIATRAITRATDTLIQAMLDAGEDPTDAALWRQRKRALVKALAAEAVRQAAALDIDPGDGETSCQCRGAGKGCLREPRKTATA